MPAPASAAIAPPAAPRALPWSLTVQVLVLIFAGCFIYAPVLHGAWLWDDGFIITGNPLMRDPSGWWKIWLAPPGPDYFPLTTTVEWAWWRIFGDNPLPFHLLCLALHLGSALLLWRLLARLGLRLAWWGAFLFVVHPVMVESVAWITELKNTISEPLLIGAMLAWLHYDERGRSSAYFTALLLFLAALLAKTSVVMLPFVLLLYAWWKHGGISRQQFIRTVPFFAVAAVLGLLTMFFQRQWAIGGEPLDIGGLPERTAAAGWALLFYFGKCLWPVDLMPVYPPWHFNELSPALFVPWLVLAIVFGWLWLRRAAGGRAVLFGLGFFVLNLAPVLGFLAMSYLRIAWVADHFVYISIIGLLGLALAGAERVLAALPPRSPLLTAALAAATTLVFLLAWQSRAYATVFRHQVALWTYNLSLNPDSAFVTLNLGLALTDAGQRAEAEAALRQSIALDGSRYGVHVALGNLLAQVGRETEAAHEFQTAISLDPDSIEAHVNYGIVLQRLGDNAGSQEQYRQATLCPAQSGPALANLAVAHFNLANVMLAQGRRADAIRHLEAAHAALPDLEPVNNLLRQLQAPPPSKSNAP